MTCLALAGKWRGTAPIEMFSRASKIRHCDTSDTCTTRLKEAATRRRTVALTSFFQRVPWKEIGHRLGDFTSGVVSLQVVFVVVP